MAKNKFLALWVAASFLLSSSYARAATEEERALNEKAAQRSFFLPGWGQAYKGHRAKGWTLGVMEAVTLTGAYLTFQSAKDAENDFRAGRAAYSDHTRRVNLANFFLLTAGAIWVYGVVDAYVSQPSRKLFVEVYFDDRAAVAMAVRKKF